MAANPIALTIAGSDPSAGAGVQADLRTFERFGVRGVSVVTALTVQSSTGVDSVYPVDPSIVASQLQTLLADLQPSAVKIGMLASAAIVDAVADSLLHLAGQNIVVDPVIMSTSGAELLDSAGRAAVLRRLVPIATLITPNLDEAALLTGINIVDSRSEREAADGLLAFGVGSVLIKGGHRSGDPVDRLFTRKETIEFTEIRIDTPHTHGTGCFLSSAIAANLAMGLSLVDAVRSAKTALTSALRTPVTVGRGRGYPSLDQPPGPVSSVPEGRSSDSSLGIHSGVIGQVVSGHESLPRRFVRSSREEHFPCPGRIEEPTGVAPDSLPGGEGRGGVDSSVPEGRSSDSRPGIHSWAIRGLYVLTDSNIRPDRSADSVVAAALAGGGRVIQLRQKDKTKAELVETARRLGALCRDAGALFIVNDDLDVALAAGADGVHLGPDDLAPADARRISGPDFIIGVSVSNVDEARLIADYASYLAVGAIYGSSTKLDAGPPVGTEAITSVKAAFPNKPIVAIGGINEHNIGDVITAGADSAAVVSAVVGADDIEAAARRLAGHFP